MQGLIKATHAGDVSLEMQRDREDKYQVIERAKSKVVTNLLGGELTYLLRLLQVAEHTSFPPVQKVLV